jgi:hypothetical protein
MPSGSLLRRRGCLVVRGHFDRGQALGWDRDIVDYVAGNRFAYVVTFLASPTSAAIDGDMIAAGGGVPGSSTTRRPAVTKVRTELAAVHGRVWRNR